MAEPDGGTDAEISAYEQNLQDEDAFRAEAITAAREAAEPVAELYFATVRAIGTPLSDTVKHPLELELSAAGFHLQEIKLSDCLTKAVGLSDEFERMSPTERYEKLTSLGVEYCQRFNRRDAVVLTAVRELNETIRSKAREQARKDHRRGVAYLFRNVMHPKEVERLRKLYGKQLFVISAFSPVEDRLKNLSLRLAGGDTTQAEDYGSKASDLISQESGRQPHTNDSHIHLAPSPYTMSIPRTWQHGDLFVDISAHEQAAEQIKRLVRLIFSDPFRTPRTGEVGMGQAYGAALESGNLARRVGAAVLDPNGDLVSIGTNDVARAGGGVYRAGEDPDHRDHKPPHQHDSSDINRKTILRDLVEHLISDPAWLRAIDLAGDPGAALADALDAAIVKDGDKIVGISAHQVDEIVRRLIQSDIAWQSQFFDVIEYGRTLHAEMDAITSAARKAMSTRGGTLFCTTMPCHECARLIIGAGLKRVIFVEPYEKSRAEGLYGSEIRNLTMHDSHSEQYRDDHHVHFIPYVGISPRRFDDLFSWIPRKADDSLAGEADLAAYDAAGRSPAARPRIARLLDGAIVKYTIATAPVRPSIGGGTDAIESVSRFIDLLIHERRTLKEFEAEDTEVGTAGPDT